MDGKCVIKLTGHTARVTGLAACPRSKLLLSCSDDGTKARRRCVPLETDGGSACVFAFVRVRACSCVRVRVRS